METELFGNSDFGSNNSCKTINHEGGTVLLQRSAVQNVDTKGTLPRKKHHEGGFCSELPSHSVV